MALFVSTTKEYNFIADHVIIGRPGFQIKDDNRPKGIKI